MRPTTVMLVVLLTWPGVAMAFVVRGVGNVSCGSWTQDHRGEATMSSLTQDNWVLGYVTAAEAFSGANKRRVDNKALTAWISNYCSKAPLDDLQKAADSLTRELRK